MDAAAWALHTDLSLDELNLHLLALEDAGLLGLAEQGGRATAYLSQRADDLGVPGRWERVEPRDWNEAWKAGIEPVTVGAISVVPPWLPAPDGLALVIEPAQAFGTGHHETTTGCLAALQELSLHGRSVLDVGTGTGVLALAAALLGAERVLAVDIDPLAVAAARENTARNAIRGVQVRAGSVEAAGDETFDVVVANLQTAVIVALADALVARLAPGGTLVASGVSNARAHKAIVALHDAGLAVWPRQGREWTLLIATRER